MDDDLPTDFQVIVVGTGKSYIFNKTTPGVMAIGTPYLSIYFFSLSGHRCNLSWIMISIGTRKRASNSYKMKRNRKFKRKVI